MRVSFKANTLNTGAATLNDTGLGAKAIKKHHDLDVQTGDIEANQIVDLVYDATGDYYQMVSPLAMKHLVIKFGTYTGDGGVSQGITGIGFQPVDVLIMYDITGSGREVFNRFSGPTNTLHHDVASHNYDADQIISLDADGFTVDDDGADAHPNQNGITYYYRAIGER
jgi:hypothetical protein